jgi:NADPH2 dehydrogenase
MHVLTLDMYMENPYPTFTHFVTSIRTKYPRFAYIHVVEPRAHGNLDRTPLEGESNDFLRKIWKGHGGEYERNGSLYLSVGGYNAENVFEEVESEGKEGELVVFGRDFTSNVSRKNARSYFFDE